MSSRSWKMRSRMYVLQRVAVCCSVLQCVAVCCSVLEYVAGGDLVSLLEDQITYVYSVLQCVAVYCVAGGELLSLLKDEITIDRVNSDGN